MSRWETAIHESGHIVAAAVLRVRPVAVILLPEGGVMAHPETGDPWVSAVIAAAGDAAGFLAELREPPMETPPDPSPNQPSSPTLTFLSDEFYGSARADWEKVRDYACCVPNSEDWHPRAVRVRHVAARIVRGHAGLILQVAERLYAAGTLNAEQLTELLPAPPPDQPRKRRRQRADAPLPTEGTDRE